MFNSNWDPLCLAIGFSKRNIIVRTSGGKIYIRRKIHAMKVDHGRTLPLCMCTQIWIQKISVQLEVRSSVSSFLLFVFFYIFPFYLPQPDILFFSKPSIIVHTFFGKKKSIYFTPLFETVRRVVAVSATALIRFSITIWGIYTIIY